MILMFFLILGFALLIKGADLLVDGASSIAKKLKVSDLVIGLTVVAFGTSTPELFVNVFASLNQNTDIAIGNILGSNIANVLFILGLAAIISPLKVTKNTIWKEIPLTLLAGVLIFVMVNDRLINEQSISALTRSDGIILLSMFLIFIYYTLSIVKDSLEAESIKTKYSLVKSFVFILFGFVCLVIGGQLTVRSAVELAILFGISQSLVGLTVVAVGTSLPELATSAVAAYKKNPDIAVGNVVGSNIFNIFFILGISATISPLPFTPILNVDVLVMILASLILFLCMFIGSKRLVDRWKGVVFILLYISYIIFLIKRG